MSFVSGFFGTMPFVWSAIFVSVWAYTLVFRKNLIQSYSVGSHIPKPQVNAHIRREFNGRYGTRLIEVDVDGAEEDEYKNFDKPASFDGNSTANKVIGGVFSLTVSFSVELIVLMMCELMNLFDEGARLLCFKVTINSLIFLITCMQPFMLISLFFNEEIIPLGQGNMKRMTTLAVYIGWFFLLHKCGDLSQVFTPDKSSYDTKSLIERKINEVSIAGITSMAILSGIGSSSTPYKLMSLRSIVALFRNEIKYDKPKNELTDADLNNLIQSYNHTNTLIKKRRSELNKLLVANSGTVYNQPNYSSDNFMTYNHNRSGDLPGSPKKNKLGGLIHKVQSFASLSSLALDKEKSEEKELRNEVDALESLKQHIYSDLMRTLDKFSSSKQQVLNKKKLLGKAIYVFNVVFAVYCIYRIINVFFIKTFLSFTSSMSSATSHDESANSRDALAITLSKLILSITNISIQETQLVNQISLVLSGSLFVCSFSSVLRTFQSFSKFFPSVTKISDTTKNWLKNLIIAELLGVYVISTALLIRTNLPSTMSNQVSRILSLTGSAITNTAASSANEVKFIDDWFDKIFGISCASTFAVFLVKKYVYDDDDVYDEEMMVENGTSYKAA